MPLKAAQCSPTTMPNIDQLLLLKDECFDVCCPSRPMGPHHCGCWAGIFSLAKCNGCSKPMSTPRIFLVVLKRCSCLSSGLHLSSTANQCLQLQNIDCGGSYCGLHKYLFCSMQRCLNHSLLLLMYRTWHLRLVKCLIRRAHTHYSLTKS